MMCIYNFNNRVYGSKIGNVTSFTIIFYQADNEDDMMCNSADVDKFWSEQSPELDWKYFLVMFSGIVRLNLTLTGHSQ